VGFEAFLLFLALRSQRLVPGIEILPMILSFLMQPGVKGCLEEATPARYHAKVFQNRGDKVLCGESRVHVGNLSP